MHRDIVQVAGALSSEGAQKPECLLSRVAAVLRRLGVRRWALHGRVEIEGGCEDRAGKARVEAREMVFGSRLAAWGWVSLISRM